LQLLSKSRINPKNDSEIKLMNLFSLINRDLLKPRAIQIIGFDFIIDIEKRKTTKLSESQIRLDDALITSYSQESPYWTVPWPVLHIPVSIAVGFSFCVFIIAIDILLNPIIEQFNMYFDGEQNASDTLIESTTLGLLDELYLAAGGQLGILSHSLKIALVALDMISLIIVPAYIATLALLYSAWFTLFLVWVGCVIASVDLGLISPGAAAFGFMLWMFTLLTFARCSVISECKSAYFWYKGYQTLKNPFVKDWFKCTFLYVIAVIIAKVVAFILCLVLWLYYMGLHALLYGW
jgi:hypothetical protein